MFKRKKPEPIAEPVFGPRLPLAAHAASVGGTPPVPRAASAPDTPPRVTPADAAAEPRTTCYPSDADAPPPVLGQPRTTVYRQAVRWNRGGYDTTN